MGTIGKDLAVITAGTKDHFNGLTVISGAKGMFWKRQMFIAFVKPERYTWQFIHDNDYFTVSYFPKQYNRIHKVYGHASGRDVDKVKESGLTPEFLEHGITYQEADDVYVCKKVYMQQIDRDQIPDDVLANYENPKDLTYGECHYIIFGEIVDHIERKA